MKKHLSGISRRFSYLHKHFIKLLLALGLLGVSALTLATPPFGFVLNQILAKGVVPENISRHMQINKNPDGTVEPWQLQLQVQGDTDFYVQHVVLQPGGYSGWHTHPGLLIGTVDSGQIDFYNDQCQKHAFSAGQVFTEDDRVHGIINTETVDADLYISYLIKHDLPRRLEAAAPSCAFLTGIP
jgi:quercetin dioxygenase-like cupin family protein